MRGRFVVREMPVFILAGGRGERLAGVSDLPKPLLEIGGRPFLGYLFDGLARAGFRRICCTRSLRPRAACAWR